MIKFRYHVNNSVKLDCILTATNDKYVHWSPYFVKFWKKLFPHVEVKIIYVGSQLPDTMKLVREHFIILDISDTIISSLNTGYIAQNIRLYYPSLLPYQNAVLLSDVDMLPMNRSYYTDPIRDVSSDMFASYNRTAICYNAASPKTWSDLFSINTIHDCFSQLISRYPNDYTGGRACPGWQTDQHVLAQQLLKWKDRNSRFIRFDNKNMLRLDRCRKPMNDQHVCISDMTQKLQAEINSLKFTDFHPKFNKQFIDEVYEALP